MRLIIHVGPKKTGTTSIQNWLYRNRNELSTMYQICYPIPHSGGLAHHELMYGINFHLDGMAPYANAQGIAEIQHPNEIFQGYMKQATELNCQTIILSSETLFELSEKQQELLLQSTEGIEEIEYTFGIRDRVSLNISRWQEEVKHGYTKSLAEYIESSSAMGTNAADYYQKLLNIQTKTASKKIKVKPFLYSNFGGEQNLFLDFLFGLNLSFVNLIQGNDVINESIKSGPMIGLLTANQSISTQSSLERNALQEEWLKPIKRALDLRKYVLKNIERKGKQYPLISLFLFTADKLEAFRKLDEMVCLSIKDFQLAFPHANHSKYEEKLRTNIEKTLNEVFEGNLSDFRSHVEKYKVIGLKLAEDFSMQE